MALLLALAVQAAQTAPDDHPLWSEVREDPEMAARREARPDLFTPPAWETVLRPTFPSAAMETEGGVVRMACVVDVAGLARKCLVMSESPEGLGFGDAAMAAVPTARWKPAAFDGEPTEVVLQFNVSFNLTNSGRAHAPAEVQTIARAVSAEGLVAAACLADLSPEIARRWDGVQARMQANPANVRPYDAMFVAGYAEGIRRSEADGKLTAAQCAELTAWAEQAKRDAGPAYAKVAADMGQEALGQFLPEAE